MLNNLFISVIRMSFTASYVILIIMIARFFLKKAPKVFSYSLWAVALLRLLCPFTFESVISLVPQKKTSAADMIFNNAITAPHTNIPMDNITAVPNITAPPMMNHVPEVPAGSSFNIMTIAAAVWIFGMVLIIAKNIFSVVELKRKLKNAQKVSENIYVSNRIHTAFVLGVIRPKIYMPDGLSPKEADYILLHEQTHIKRLDPIMKTLAFAALCIHWFNPIVWLAFFAGSKDMEMSCDEKVIKTLGNGVKKDYSRSLLALATGKKYAGGILAFGEGDTKDRIKNVLNYKKPAFWIVILLVIAVIIASFALLTNQKDKEEDVLNAGIDAVASYIDYDENTILVQTIGQKSSVPPKFIAKFDEKTYFVKVENGKTEEISIDDIKVGQHLIFHITKLEDGEIPTYYAETVQIAQKEEILDSDGNNIRPIIEDLWFKANNAYDVDALSKTRDEENVFELGESVYEYGPEYNELLNAEDALKDVFTPKAEHEFFYESGRLIKYDTENNKIYRLGAWKTGYAYENVLTGMAVKEKSKDKMTLIMQYAAPGAIFVEKEEYADYEVNYGYTYMTIKKSDGKWLVDNLYFPEAGVLGFPIGRQCRILQEDIPLILNNYFGEYVTAEYKNISENSYVYDVKASSGNYTVEVYKSDGMVIPIENKNVSQTNSNYVKVTFPFSYEEMNDNNKEIFEIPHFRVTFNLPEGYTFTNGESTNKYNCAGVWDKRYIYGINGEPVGSIGYNIYDAEEYAKADEKNRMMIYNQIALSNHYFFAVGNDDPVVIKQDDLDEILLTNVYISNVIAPDFGYKGETNNIGIVANNQKMGVYVAIELDSEKVTQEIAEQIAQSLAFEEYTLRDQLTDEIQIQNQQFEKNYEKLTGEEKSLLEEKLTEIIISHKNGTYKPMENHHEPWPENFPSPSVLPDKITDENYKVYFIPGEVIDDNSEKPPYLNVWLNIQDDYYYIFEPAWFEDMDGNISLGFGNSGFYQGEKPFSE